MFTFTQAESVTYVHRNKICTELLFKICPFNNISSYDRYTIHDLQAEKKYMLNMNLSVCFEQDGPCLVSVPVFENTKLPKLGCDWDVASFGK